MKLVVVLGLIALILPAATAFAAPGDMSVATFLVKANALKNKGPLALFSGDVKVLQAEAKGGAMAYRAQLASERKVGRPSSCPPAKAALNSDDLLAQMESYPQSARANIPVRAAMADLFKKRFACGK